jgi:hypothetical protein
MSDKSELRKPAQSPTLRSLARRILRAWGRLWNPAKGAVCLLVGTGWVLLAVRLVPETPIVAIIVAPLMALAVPFALYMKDYMD